MDTRFRGYIAMWYTYYNSDSYFSKLALNKYSITRNLVGLWMTFTLLNVLIPISSMTRGRQVARKIDNLTTRLNKRLYGAVMLVVILFNTLYVISTILMTIRGQPSILQCYFSMLRYKCRTLSTSTSHNYIIAILITKALIVPAAFLVEFTVAFYTANTLKEPVQKRSALLKKVFITWQLLVFVQITVGLMSIPLLVLAFISPAQVLLECGGLLLLPTMVIFVISFIPLPNLRNCRVCGFLRSCLLATEILTSAIFITSAGATYIFIVKGGIDMDGFKGYIVSLIPAIPVPILVWVFKSKFLAKTFIATKGKGPKRECSGEDILSEKRRESFTSSDEELVNLSDT